MCGFVGFYNFGNENSLTKATQRVSHRGPDHQGIFWNNAKAVGLGHRRLSILDLSDAANQPFWSEDKRYCIVYNGEVFNYLHVKKELIYLGFSFRTNSDTEVLLVGFSHFGKEILNKISGMFSFVIYDLYKNTFFAARDHIGVKPFYYYFLNDQLILASEIKSITSVIDAIPDYQALQNPVHFQTVPLTGFQHIYKLKPGHFLTYDGKKLDIQRFWEIEINENKNLGFYEKVEHLDVLLNDSVKMQMVSDVPIGILLSGGLDSSLIAALMRKNSNSEINSFTIKIGEKDLRKQGIVDDSVYASKVASTFGLNHHEIEIEADILKLLPMMVYHLEEILVDPAAINTYLISQSARSKGISVLLSGIGADEIFSGYRIHKVMNELNKREFINSSLFRMLSFPLLQIPNELLGANNKYIRWLKKIVLLLNLPVNQRHIFAKDSAVLPKDYNHLFNTQASIFSTNHFQAEEKLFSKYLEVSYLNKLCLSDTSIFLPDHNLNYMDKMMMAASVEGRPPLIDKKIVEFAFTCGERDKIAKGSQKHILKEVSRKYLTNEIITRPKAPFAAPLRSWLRNELKEMVYDLVNQTNINRRGIYNSTHIDNILKQHYTGKEDHSQMIFKFLITEIWFSTFFDKK